MATDIHVSAAGDSAIVVEFVEFGERGSGVDLDADANARAIALARRLKEEPIGGVLDIVPALRTLGVHFDPVRIDPERLTALVRAAAEGMTGVQAETGRLHRVPVCYGGVFGPDLPEVAGLTGLSEEAVVSLHSGSAYRVFMLGFTAGFAYLGSIDAALVVPRRATPRAVVPGGSVAIAGRQTAIYPSDTPGGWRVIGRTWIRPFEQRRPEPCLFAPGDRVEFVPVPASEFVEDAR